MDLNEKNSPEDQKPVPQGIGIGQNKQRKSKRRSKLVPHNDGRPITISETRDENPLLLRRPTAVVWTFPGCLTTYKFEREIMRKFAAENFRMYLDYMKTNEKLKKRLVDVEKRLRRDSKIDLDAGDVDVPQIVDSEDYNEVWDSMFKYFQYRLRKSQLHQYSPIKWLIDRICRKGLLDEELKMPIFDDAFKAVRAWRHSEYFIKNYTIDAMDKIIQQ